MNQKNKEYWLNRAIVNDKKTQKDLKKLEKQLKKKFVEASKEIKKELAYFYANMTEITEHEKYRLEGTLQAINRSLDNLYHNEEQMLNNRLIMSYIDMYEDTIADLSIKTDINISFNVISENLIREVVKTNWSGLTFSERIWENRRKLALAIKQELNAGLIRGDSLQTIANIISQKLNSSFSDAMRLAHTETAWIQNQAEIKGYEEANVVKYEFSAFLDNRTSPICQSLDGKVFNTKDALAGTNLPPLHPRCRSCILPITD